MAIQKEIQFDEDKFIKLVGKHRKLLEAIGRL